MSDILCEIWTFVTHCVGNPHPMTQHHFPEDWNF